MVLNTIYEEMNRSLLLRNTDIPFQLKMRRKTTLSNMGGNSIQSSECSSCCCHGTIPCYNIQKWCKLQADLILPLRNTQKKCNWQENIARQNIHSAVRSSCKNLTSKEQLNAPSAWTSGPKWSLAIGRLVKDDMTPLRQRRLRGVMDLVAPASTRSHIAACQPACQEPHCGIN